MRKVRLDMKSLHQAVAQKHARIVVGNRYFLSHFLDKEGAIVRVLNKSTRKNRAGFNSTVLVEVLESDCNYYKPGAEHTVNAANLYEHRMYASPSFKCNWSK
jgi:hypothetical protein